MLRHRLKQLWDAVRTSFWFLPTVIIVACTAAAILLIRVDTTANDRWLASWPRLFGASADGARSMLSTIAGSIMSAVGVTFSMTLVAITLASSQYTPRILRNFVRSRQTQVVLGFFTGIFAYCIVVLRTIRGTDAGTFVPSLAVFGSMVLALVGSILLVLFIHHVATSIQASQIISSVADETLETIDRLFPQDVGDPRDDQVVDEGPGPWRVILSTQSGYVQSVDGDALVGLAGVNDIVVRMERAVGDFVIESEVLASVRGSRALGAAAVDQVRDAFTISRIRTVEQDPGFGVRQLVDIALKALSPGINDTTTAVICVNYLSVILSRLAVRHIPSAYRYEDGMLRVVTRGVTFAGLVDEANAQIRACAGGNVAVLARMVDGLGTLEQLSVDPARRVVLLEQLEWIGERIASIESAHERARITSQLEALRARLHVARHDHALAV